MRPKIYMFGGHLINDGTNYDAGFVRRTNAFFRQADGISNELLRSDHSPVIASIGQKSKTMEISIIPRGAFADQMDELNAWFDTYDKELYSFIVKDEDDGNRQWYVKARPESILKAHPDEFVVSLKVPDPIWRTVTADADVWNITATGQTKNVTTLGNRPARPVLTFTPNVAKTGGFGYFIERVWRNPIDYAYVDEPLDVVNASWNTQALIQDAATTNQLNGAIGAGDLTINIDTPVGGGLPVGGGMCYAGSTGEQIYYTGISAGVMTVYNSGGVTGRGWGGTTAQAEADNAVLKYSHLCADGRDVRVFRNGRSIPRWLNGINTTATKVFTICDFALPISLTLDEAIVGTGPLSYVKVALGDVVGLEKISHKGHTAFCIGTECFTFTSVDRPARKLLGITRGVFSSAKASHSKGDAVYWIEYSYRIAYGNALLAAPTQNETKKPIFDMPNSTNTTRRYLEFYEQTGLRAGGFKTRWVRGQNSGFYTGSHNLVVSEPASEIGFAGRVNEIGGAPRGDTYALYSYLYHPAGFTSVTCNGDKYRYTVDWATYAGIFQGDSLTRLINVYTEASPGSVQSWAAWSKTQALAGYQYLAFGLVGNISARQNNVHYFEVQTITSLSLNSSKVPQLVSSGAETGAYELDGRLTNNTNGMYIDIQKTMSLGESLEIDCEAQTGAYLMDNTSADEAVDFPKRSEMFLLGVGLNQLQWDDAGTKDLTIDLDWHNRNS